MNALVRKRAYLYPKTTYIHDSSSAFFFFFFGTAIKSCEMLLCETCCGVTSLTRHSFTKKGHD